MSKWPRSRSSDGRRARAVLVVLAVLAPTADAGEIPPGERRSGYDFMAPATKAMQDDPTANPGMLTVLEGERLWRANPAGKPACADCHGDAAASMKGVAARYPAIDTRSGAAMTLAGRIESCRVERQGTPPSPEEGRELVALTAVVAAQSRGLAIAPPEDARLEAVRERGRELFHLRQGQLNMSCSQCHDDNWGKRLAGATILQGHPTGYPIYRLEWQATGSLARRLRNCLFGMRAEPPADGGPDAVALEAYLMGRARSLAIETPAVRP
jgi:sulfur-oxidizing protein SoxA